VQPFANTLYKVTVSGAQLRAYLERLVEPRPSVHVSGVTITYDSAAAAGSRILSATVAGRAIRDDRTYTVVMNDFMVTGGDGLALARGARAVPLNLVDLDVLIDYARSRPQPVAAPDDVRIRAVSR
jgi:5'-nucleotidase